MPAGTVERASPSAAAPTPAGDPRPERLGAPAEGRKSSKPIMEKRRRARINESLGQLKTLILDALKKDSSRHSKLEKADILEMTVKHLRHLQRLQTTTVVTADPSVLGKYRAGFSECVGEVTRFLSTCEGVNTDVRTRLLGHLAACVTQISAVTCGGSPVGTPGQAGAQVPALWAQQVLCKGSSQMHAPPEAAGKVFGGFQVVPSPDGQFAFLLPSAALTPLTAPSGRHAPPGAPAATSDSVWRPW